MFDACNVRGKKLLLSSQIGLGAVVINLSCFVAPFQRLPMLVDPCSPIKAPSFFNGFPSVILSTRFNNKKKSQ